VRSFDGVGARSATPQKFIPPGAKAFKRDVPDADVRFLEAGHFALETNLDDVASAMLSMTVNA
jgi:hypothetical protein